MAKAGSPFAYGDSNRWPWSLRRLAATQATALLVGSACSALSSPSIVKPKMASTGFTPVAPLPRVPCKVPPASCPTRDSTASDAPTATTPRKQQIPRATSFQLASGENKQQGVSVFAKLVDPSGSLAYDIAEYLKDITAETGLVLLRYSVVRSCNPCESRRQSTTNQVKAQHFNTVLLQVILHQCRLFPSNVNQGLATRSACVLSLFPSALLLTSHKRLAGGLHDNFVNVHPARSLKYSILQQPRLLSH